MIRRTMRNRMIARGFPSFLHHGATVSQNIIKRAATALGAASQTQPPFHPDTAIAGVVSRLSDIRDTARTASYRLSAVNDRLIGQTMADTSLAEGKLLGAPQCALAAIDQEIDEIDRLLHSICDEIVRTERVS
jgi:hypothetical protein